MFYIVNETEKEFNLVKIDNGDLFIVNGETKLPIMSLSSESKELEAILDEKIKDVIVRPKRTTKIYPKMDNGVVLYNDLDVPVIFSEEKGQDKSAYKFPKSVVIVVTDVPEGSNLRYTEDEDDKKKLRPVERKSGEDADGIYVDFYFVSLSKWDDIQDIAIELPSGHTLKFGILNYANKDGKKTKINALIRYDKDGNEVKPSEKKENPQQKKKYNFKNKKDKKRAHRDLVNSIPPVKAK